MTDRSSQIRSVGEKQIRPANRKGPHDRRPGKHRQSAARIFRSITWPM